MIKITSKYYLLLIIPFLIYFMYLYHQDAKNNTCNKGNYESIFHCMQTGNLHRQEQYDIFYNIAKNEPPLSIILDNNFYLGFQLAYNNCIANGPGFNCNKHDESIYENFQYECILNSQKNSICISDFIETNIKTGNIKDSYINLIEKGIEKNKINPQNWTCNSPLKSIYYKFPPLLQKEIPSHIKNVCNLK